MSCKSAIYTVNATSQLNAANAQVPFGSVVRRFGSNCQLDGGSIILDGPGYYDVSISLSTAPTAAGEITAQLYKDGVAIPGANATVTAAAGGDTVVLPIICTVRNCGQCCSGTLALFVTADHTPINFATKVRKL